MDEFILLAVAMITFCVAIMLFPLWYGSPVDATVGRRREANIAIYRQRCAELAEDVAAGRISPAEFQTEKDRLGARLLDEVSVEKTPRERVKRPWFASVLGVALIVVGSGAAYLWFGDWQAVSERHMPNVDQLLDQLRQQVAQQPKDQGVRLLLAQVQLREGDYSGAAHNLAIINHASLHPNPDFLVAEAQARLDAGESLSGRAGDLFAQALKLDPKNIKALWYLGLRAVEAGRNQQAKSYWQRLLEQKLPQGMAAMVRTRINGLKDPSNGAGNFLSGSARSSGMQSTKR